MNVLASLRSRIFLASAVLAMLCIGVAIYLVNVTVTQEAERTLEREIVATGAQIDQLRAERTRTFTLMARLIADLPKLKAAVETNDPPTVQDVAVDYQSQLNANLVLITNRHGDLLFTAGGSPRAAAVAAHQPAVREALAGHDSVSLLPQPNGILQVVTVPIAVDRPRRQIFGTLGVGFLLDDALLADLKRITGSDLAFGMNGQILASTLPRERSPALAEHLRLPGISRVQLDAEEYTALSRSLSSDAAAPGATAAGGAADAAGTLSATSPGPVAVILRSRTAQLESLRAIHTGFAVTGVLAMVLAMALSFAVARTIARPLAAITDVMREVAATGDLTRKIALRYRNRWDDEDARLLASTFNTLTDSIARFQREMSQKERLTSLGRLSTVIAHEVRNPLMIIKAALHTLRQPDPGPEALREAAEDIDGEVARLNGIVNDVLDFARPIKFTLAPVEINTLCRESAAAAVASGPGSQIGLHLDPALATMTTDAERLRIALVNMLVNARHAVNGDRPVGRVLSDPPAPFVTLTTRADGDRVRIVVADRGVGIAATDIPQVFDPYFTTKRGGSGLGLPIAKNIVEGLGGTIAVSSTPGLGTEFQIDLPGDPPAAGERPARGAR
jgi:signal transduction histidine kinase